MNDFHGSYAPDDVTFLLKPLTHVENLPPEEKERAMQRGERHYSEMLTPEKLPSAAYLALFSAALQDNGARMARDCVTLATQIAHDVTQPILVSLARAGTPVGVVLKHLLTIQLGQDVPHYSISIIRDRGIDANALDEILRRHGGDGRNLVFIDGWTGKGVINRELQHAVRAYNHSRHTAVPARLYVLSDLAGVAWQSASYDDYLIPSAILNATVSGLVSRSVLNQQIGAEDFHGCLFYREFAAADRSRAFVAMLLHHAATVEVSGVHAPNAVAKQRQYDKMQAFMAEMRQRFAITDDNLIKPGIGEATRVLLRRLPERVLVRDAADADVRHLLALADEKGVAVTVEPDLPFSAVSLIRSAI